MLDLITVISHKQAMDLTLMGYDASTTNKITDNMNQTFYLTPGSFEITRHSECSGNK